MLKILPEWSDAVVVRTRDETELAKCDAVVDVGGVYDATTFRQEGLPLEDYGVLLGGLKLTSLYSTVRPTTTSFLSHTER